MFRHEACSSSDVIAAVKAAQSQNKLSETKKAAEIAEKEAIQKAIKEAPKTAAEDERSQDIFGLRKYEK
jgi:hypothetical protein